VSSSAPRAVVATSLREKTHVLNEETGVVVATVVDRGVGDLAATDPIPSRR
jgi:hypothetical protein